MISRRQKKKIVDPVQSMLVNIKSDRRDSLYTQMPILKTAWFAVRHLNIANRLMIYPAHTVER
jgi:hypothetical protein